MRRKPGAIWEWQWAKIQTDYRKGKRQVHPESHIMFIKTKWFFLSKTPVLYLTQCSDAKSRTERSWTSHCGLCQFFFVSSPCRLQHTRAFLEHTSRIIYFPRMLSPSRILQAATLIACVPMGPLDLLLDPSKYLLLPPGCLLRHTVVSYTLQGDRLWWFKIAWFAAAPCKSVTETCKNPHGLD